MTIRFSLEISRSLHRCSHCCAEGTAFYLKSDDLELKPWSLVAPITRPAFGTGTRLFPQWEGERNQTSGCHGNWRKGPQSYRSSGTLTFITFNSIFSITPLLSHILLFFLSHFFPSFCLCLHLIRPPTVIPRVTMQGLYAAVILDTLRDKVAPDDWWPLVQAGMKTSL